MRILAVLVALVATSCTLAETGVAEPSEPISISLSLYVVDDASNPESSPLSSQRSTEDLESISVRIQDIWSDAGIDLTLRTITRMTAPTAVLEQLALGETAGFIDSAVAGDITVPEPGVINGFYVRQLGSANGIAPFGTLFFVTDEPSVHDERVSSHEIGHILGLRHTQDDTGRLMFSATNGMTITHTERHVAQYTATGILDGNR